MKLLFKILFFHECKTYIKMIDTPPFHPIRFMIENKSTNACFRWIFQRNGVSKMLQKCFQNPPASYRIVPFWFWNGDMSEAAIELQIGEMADKGVGGFFICARQGLTVPYLSQVWFDRVRFAVETAKTFGLEVWIYDEYPYPSGMAGGEVTLEHPDAKHHTLWSLRETREGNRPIHLELPLGQGANGRRSALR
ncbi:hypothetical protein [Cohnella rhizosphaerae]|uniref:Uncharacterized protein n=1 Tax=Cohnella rhizosphaerae TaxID=1457232 RepID=A0A9X4QRF0_9BACL|nr:hypothetical protein [Cohnella rhizosphaerae]MDG0808510.1 hypothetical protein [Cohnella rhizosphaerae]